MKKKSTEIFENAPIPKAVFLNIIPSIVSMLMVLVYNLADTFFIGQTKNALMVAAVSQATPAFLLFMAIGMLFGIGGTSLISRLLGQGRKAEARKACSFCFWTGLGVGVVGMLAILIFNEPISWLVGATESTIEYVRQYLVIVAFGVPFLIIGRNQCFLGNDPRKPYKHCVRPYYDPDFRMECSRCCYRYRTGQCSQCRVLY